MRRTKRALAIMAFTLASCSSPAIPASTPTSHTITLRLYATTPTIPLLQDLISQYSQGYPAYIFETSVGNYETILEKLLSGETPYALTNHLPDNLIDDPVLAWPIGQDGIAVIVHPSNLLQNLTLPQLRGIYLGHFSNWNEVGGADETITVISREDGSGTRAEFERLVMGTRQTTLSAQIAPSSSAMVESIADLPGAIGYVSLSYVEDRIGTLTIDDIAPTLENVFNNIYPLRTTLYVMGLAEPEGDYLQFISWIQSQVGQTVVAQQYAPLLRP
jgi:phosphate transport system substrate-binding protein